MQLHLGAASFPIWGIMVPGRPSLQTSSPGADTLILSACRFA